MDGLSLVIVLLGLALIITLVYLALSGQPVPPVLKIIVLVAVALMVALCLLHTVGCNPGPVRPTPVSQLGVH